MGALVTNEEIRERKRELRKHQFWTIEEAALMVNKTRWTVNRWVSAGLEAQLNPLNGVRYVRANDVTAWAAEHATRRSKTGKSLRTNP
jgi:hypothetical protein